MADPFTSDAVGVPTGSPAASQVYKAYMNVSVATGTGGFGYFAITPCTSNDIPCAVFTGSASTVSTVEHTAPVGGGSAAFTQLPYSTSAHNAQSALGGTSVVSRVVACSIRAVNQTATINIGGKLRMGQTQFGNCIGTNFNSQQDLICGNAYQSGADNETREIRWQTSHTSDLEYNNWDSTAVGRDLPFSAAGNGTNPYPCMYVMVQAPTGGTTQYVDIQVCIIVEYAGFVAAGLPISRPVRSLPSADFAKRVRDMVIQRIQDNGNQGLVVAKPKDDWISWLTRQGDRTMNILFDRPIQDPTGRAPGSSITLLKDVIKTVAPIVVTKGKAPKTGKAALTKQLARMK